MTIENLEEKLRNAMLTSDVAVLDELIADDLVWTMHTGKVVKKPPQLNMNPALTLPDVRPLATLFIFLLVSSLPVKASLSPETTTPKTFADWCLNKANLSRETLHTIDVMLQEAKTQDCHQAEKLLSTLTKLVLWGKQIADLRPLSSLTHSKLASTDPIGLRVLSLTPDQVLM
jgi:hypothetical protein